MEYTSKSLENLINAFSQLPGIGKKSAQRVALYLLEEGKHEAENLANTILELHLKVGHCSVCFNLTEDDPCLYCRDPQRHENVICIVEEPKDLMAIENTGGYRGKYHVLGGVLSPLYGIGAEQLHIKELLARIDNKITEVIIATNPTVEGEMTAAQIIKLLKEKSVKISRIARGIPYGGSLEFNDAVTVAKALEGRMQVE